MPCREEARPRTALHMATSPRHSPKPQLILLWLLGGFSPNNWESCSDSGVRVAASSDLGSGSETSAMTMSLRGLALAVAVEPVPGSSETHMGLSGRLPCGSKGQGAVHPCILPEPTFRQPCLLHLQWGQPATLPVPCHCSVLQPGATFRQPSQVLATRPARSLPLLPFQSCPDWMLAISLPLPPALCSGHEAHGQESCLQQRLQPHTLQQQLWALRAATGRGGNRVVLAQWFSAETIPGLL